ncbi:MAG: OB-fold domain-containing protein [Pseudomonadota bacterium]
MTHGVEGDYLGMPLQITGMDQENLAFFRHCAAHELHLQRCRSCGLLRYPPTTGCPWCGHAESVWAPVEAKGTVFTYAEVHHAIQPAFRDHLPYLILIVELDTQQAAPGEHDALRIAGNLVRPDAELAPPEQVARVGIGTRVRMVFKDVAEGLAVPLWTIDESAEQPSAPWRYPDA